MTTDSIFNIDIDGNSQTLALADLLALDMTGVGEFRGAEAIPEGVAELRFKAVTPEVTMMRINGKDPNSPKEPVARIVFTLEVIAYRQLKDRSIDANSVIGMVHNERFNIKTKQDIERVNAFLHDAGINTANVTLEQALQNAVSAAISCVVTQRDVGGRKYSDIDRGSLRPLAPPQPHVAHAAAHAVAPTPVPAAPRMAGLAGLSLGR